MPFYEKNDVRIHYEEAGSGFPLFIIYGGGLDSAIAFPEGPFDAVAEFKSEYRCITMDLRNSNRGQSSGPLEYERPWDCHTDDQFGLLDHLGVEKFLALGFCIGSPLIWNMLKRSPERVVAAAAVQPSAADPNRPDHFYKRNLEKWAPALLKRRPDLTMETIEKYLRKMYKDADFVVSVSRDFVRNCQKPLLVMPDDIDAHPYAVAMEMAYLAPLSEVSLYPWVDTKQNTALALRHLHTFLRAYCPKS